MARKDTIKNRLVKELSKQLAFGQSKKADQDINRDTRRELKALGISREEQLRFNACDYKIYSKSTFECYKREIKQFGTWLIKNGNKNIEISECEKYIQQYLDHERERGQSANSQNTSRAAICKCLHLKTFDYEIDRRNNVDIKKSRNHNGPIKSNIASELNKTIGLRASDLKRLRVDNIHFREGRMEIIVDKCKGGKTNKQIIYDKDKQEKVLDYISEHNLRGHDRLFDTKLFKSDVDFQMTRRIAAQDRYREIVKDMEENPERRNFYKDEIKRIFKEDGKRLRENLDKDIYCRADKRQKAIELYGTASFDRVAAMMVSVTMLAHYRTEVTISNYFL